MEPIGKALNPEEQAVLAILLQEGRADQACTTRGVVTVLDREPLDLGGVLARLERKGFVARESEAGKDCWRADFGTRAA